jgi:hypothetical protein
MHYAVLASHGPEICPTSNAKSRDFVMQTAPQIPKIAEKVGVKVLAGPYVSREHISVIIVEASTSENLDTFLVESRLPQWNSCHILPALPMEQGVEEIPVSA